MFRSKSGRFLCKQIDSFSNVYISKQKALCSNAEGQSNEKVVIPPRMERRPTDILEALSSTVDLKSTAFHYKYPDDPYFYTTSRFSEKIYALSLESGRKSARWIFKENPKFFMNVLSEPPIKEFIPKEAEATELEATETALDCTIKERNIPEAIKVYKTLQEQNVKVSNSLKQSLLELVCFFNSQEKPNFEVEQKWFLGKPLQLENTWKATNFATELFESMDPSCPLATSTMIQGMFKHNDIDSALDLLESAKVKKIRLSVGVYNALLSKLHFLHPEYVKAKFRSIEHILKEMSQQKIKPNLGTLNSTLSSISKSKMIDKFNMAEKVMNEFTKLNIEPSLGSFGFIFCCLKGPTFSSYGHHLLTSIEHKHHRVLHPTDFEFFSSAMRAIDLELKDPDLAIRLMEMFERNNNSKFIVYDEDKNEFYKHFVFLIFKETSIDTAMKFYKAYSLTRFFGDATIYRMILLHIRKSRQYHYLPFVWKEMEQGRASSQRMLTKQILAMVNEIETEDELKVCHAAAIAYLKDKNRMNEIRSDTWSSIVVTLLKNKDYATFQSFWEEVEDYLDILNWSPSAITEMYNYGASQNKKPFILEILRIAKDASHPEILEMATNALPLLDENDKPQVQQILEECETDKSNKI